MSLSLFCMVWFVGALGSTKSKILLGRIPTCESEHSWWPYSAAWLLNPTASAIWMVSLYTYPTGRSDPSTIWMVSLYNCPTGKSDHRHHMNGVFIYLPHWEITPQAPYEWCLYILAPLGDQTTGNIWMVSLYSYSHWETRPLTPWPNIPITHIILMLRSLGVVLS